MATTQLCISAFVCLFVLFDPSFAAQLVGNKVQQRGVAGHLISLAPQTIDVSARVAEDVRNSHARLEFLSGTASRFVDPRSPVAAVPGGYSMSIQLGTPAQTFMAIVDTGNEVSWVQCKPCIHCFIQPDALFDPSKSSTYSTLLCSNKFSKDIGIICRSNQTCNFQFFYGDESTASGALSSETLRLNGTSIPKFTFGCGTNNQATFQGVDGIVGLGRGPLSLPSQLGTLVGHKFSYCLVSSTVSSKVSPIVFGDSAVPSAKGVVYTPLVFNSRLPNFYYATLKDINVGGKQLKIPSSAFAIDPSSGTGGFIFDSGTTITELTQVGYDALKKELQSLIPYPSADGSQVGLDLCFDVSGFSNPPFPEVTFNFDGADFHLPTKNTFLAIDKKGKTMCLAMAGTDFQLSIFGNIQQQGFQMVFDISKSQLGWISSQC